MSIFGSIMSKIFGHARAASPTPAQPDARAQPQNPTQQTQFSPAPQAQQGAGGSQAPVDVDAVLKGMAAQNSQKLNWRESIVDLMKLLNLDSSLAARKELAQELHYTGNMDDSAAMNIWLHKQVMQKLAQNGGKVPPDLMH